MNNEDQFRFVSLLALELENGDISLPSLPDVVLKIRRMLESDDCDFQQISKAVSVDPVLVSRLFVFANSAYYNRANVGIETLDAAIGRLGLEVVRNTAMSLAMKQLYASEKHSHAASYLKAVWANGMKLSSMAHAVAKLRSTLNEETAFLFIGDRTSFESVLEEWNAQVSKSIIESWGFSTAMAESADPEHYLDTDPDSDVSYADVVAVAKQAVNLSDDKLEGRAAEDPSFIKLGVTMDAMPGIMGAYRDKLTTMQQSLNQGP